jgi:hypothetical protein
MLAKIIIRDFDEELPEDAQLLKEAEVYRLKKLQEALDATESCDLDEDGGCQSCSG